MLRGVKRLFISRSLEIVIFLGRKSPGIPAELSMSCPNRSDLLLRISTQPQRISHFSRAFSLLLALTVPQSFLTPADALARQPGTETVSEEPSGLGREPMRILPPSSPYPPHPVLFVKDAEAGKVPDWGGPAVPPAGDAVEASRTASGVRAGLDEAPAPRINREDEAEPSSPGPEGVRTVVVFADGVAEAEKAQILSRLEGSGGRRIRRLNQHLEVIEFAAGGGDPEEAMARLREDPRVRAVERDGLIHAHGAEPNDPFFFKQWALRNEGQGTCAYGIRSCSKPGADISATLAWEVTTGSHDVVVAVIDTGVDLDHPDLEANLLRGPDGKVVGHDFVNGDDDPMDDNGHGTGIASVIGAVGNNKTGIAGVAWNVSIMPVKVLDATGNGYVSGAVAGIDFAIEHGAHIINASFGGMGPSEALLGAIRRAEAKGILVVTSAGQGGINLDESSSVYPAVYSRKVSNLMAVAATDWDDWKYGLSNYGRSTTDLAAPGVEIVVLALRAICWWCDIQASKTMEGTSVAAAFVSGAAALVKSLYPGADAKEIRARLTTSADRNGEIDGYTRSGRLNVWKAIQPDAAPPGRPEELVVTHVSSTGARLRWKASGDDWGQGTVARYQISYSTNRDMTAAETVETDFPPGPPGTVENFDLGGLLPGTQYYLTLRAVDKAGRISDEATAGPFMTRSSPIMDGAEGGSFIPGPSGRMWDIVAQGCKSGRRCYATPADLSGQSAWMEMKQSIRPQGPAMLAFWWRHDPGGAVWQLEVIVAPEGCNCVISHLAGYGGPAAWTLVQLDLSRYIGQSIRIGISALPQVEAGGGPPGRLMVDGITMTFQAPGRVDDVEGEPQFTGLPGWAITTEESSSPKHSWTDSPHSACSNNVHSSLVQKSSFDIPQNIGGHLRLAFRAKVDLERAWDFLRIYASPDDGDNWIYLGMISGTEDWRTYAFELPAGWRKVRTMFRLETSAAVCKDGVYLDDIGIWGEEFVPNGGPVPGQGGAGGAGGSGQRNSALQRK